MAGSTSSRTRFSSADRWKSRQVAQMLLHGTPAPRSMMQLKPLLCRVAGAVFPCPSLVLANDCSTYTLKQSLMEPGQNPSTKPRASIFRPRPNHKGRGPLKLRGLKNSARPKAIILYNLLWICKRKIVLSSSMETCQQPHIYQPRCCRQIAWSCHACTNCSNVLDGFHRDTLAMQLCAICLQRYTITSQQEVRNLQ